MSAKTQDIINGLIDSIGNLNSEKTSFYDATAIVKRVENGIAWVHFDGGAEETPAKLTMSAKIGDEVLVRVSGGSAFIVGNVSAPPTDDSLARTAKSAADAAMTQASRATNAADLAVEGARQASIAAQEALSQAELAGDAAEAAQSSATEAQSSASDAYEAAQKAQRQVQQATISANEASSQAREATSAANEAKDSARVANATATGALSQLSVIEKVTETLRWLSDHATFVPTTDTEVDPTKYYFREIGIYYLTADTSIVDGKDYYDVESTEVQNPINADLRLYYEKGLNGDIPYYFLTKDATVNNKFHYELTDQSSPISSETIYYTLVGEQVEEPDSRDLYYYYELVNDVYVQTSDTEIDSGKTYYTVEGTEIETPVEEDKGTYYERVREKIYYTLVGHIVYEPQEISLDHYYEIKTVYDLAHVTEGDPSALGYYEAGDIDESISNYISTHLALLDDGLYVTLDNNGYKLKLSNDGAYIMDDTGKTVSTYSDVTMIGNSELRHVYIDDDSVDIKNGEKILASFGEVIYAGDPRGKRIELSQDGMSVWFSRDTMLLKVTSSGLEPTIESEPVPAPTTFPAHQSYTYTIGMNHIEPGSKIKVTMTGVSFGHNLRHDQEFDSAGDVQYSDYIWYYDAHDGTPANYFLLKYDPGHLYPYLSISSLYAWDVSYFHVSVEYRQQLLDTTAFMYGDINTEVTPGKYSFTVGSRSYAEGDYSISMGRFVGADGDYSVALGSNAQAYFESSVAIGSYVHSRAYGGIVIGSHCDTYGKYGLSTGRYTTSTGSCQTVIGKYNEVDGLINVTDIADSRTYAFIIGNGKSDTERSNALTVDWDGNVNIPSGAEYQIDGTSINDLYVSKSGDTMSGTLTVSVARNASYKTKFTDIDASIGQTAPSSNIYWDKSYVLDKNDRLMHYEEGVWKTDNSYYLSYALRRYTADGSSSYTHGFTLSISNTGDCTVILTHQNAWLNALGFIPPIAVSNLTLSLLNCTGTITGQFYLSVSSNHKFVQVYGRVRITSFVRKSSNPGVNVTLPFTPSAGRGVPVGYRGESPVEQVNFTITANSTKAILNTTETYTNAANGTLTLMVPYTIVEIA